MGVVGVAGVGMTWECVGMMGEGAGVAGVADVGMRWEGVGMTWVGVGVAGMVGVGAEWLDWVNFWALRRMVPAAWTRTWGW